MKFSKIRLMTFFVAALFAAPLVSEIAKAQGGATKNRQAAPKPVSPSKRFAHALRSRADFDSLARVYTDQPYALPHVIFIIDRKDKNKIYYANSRLYRFHKDFVNANYLSL